MLNAEGTLQIWPKFGNMLGGAEINITGPCFDDNPWFYCKWGDDLDAQITIGEIPLNNEVPNGLRARCIQPAMYFIGRLNLSISLDEGKTFAWKAEYTVGESPKNCSNQSKLISDLKRRIFQVDPIRFPPQVELVHMTDWFQQEPPGRLVLRWIPFDVSWIESDPVNIELYGYYEDDYGPHWDFLQVRFGRSSLFGPDKAALLMSS